MEDAQSLGMFKAYDIRTKASSLDACMKRRLVESIGIYIKNSIHSETVVVARDARLHCPELMELMIEIFPAMGLDVLVNPLQISTCQFYFSCMKHIDAAGVMITASHNPGAYVGMKIVGPGVTPIAFGCGPDGGIARIRDIYKTACGFRHSAARGKVHLINEAEHFADYSMTLAGIGKGELSGLRIQGEFLSGTAGVDVASAFDKAGADMHLRNMVPDGFFPTGDPNPIIESSILPAREAIKGSSMDFGFCFDGDGDRMDIMDGQGRQIVPGFNMAILIPEIKSIFSNAFPGQVWNPQLYADVKAIPLALTEIASAGVGVHMIRNGHSFIKEKLLENFPAQYLAAEEESAHYYMNMPVCPDDWSKGRIATENTLFFSLLTAKMWGRAPQKYERAIALQNSFARIREWPLRFDSAPEQMPRIMDDVERAMAGMGASIINTMDDGSDLDATLMRFGLPQSIDGSTILPDRWCQVAQRISRSEDAMTRWEVVAADQETCKRFNDVIIAIADRYVEKGFAAYGKESVERG